MRIIETIVIVSLSIKSTLLTDAQQSISIYFRFLLVTIKFEKNFSFKIRAEAGYLYDAVHLYADALIHCLVNEKDPKNGTEIINAIRGRSYQSAMG
jgi:hypothetical protein